MYLNLIVIHFTRFLNSQLTIFVVVDLLPDVDSEILCRGLDYEPDLSCPSRSSVLGDVDACCVSDLTSIRQFSARNLVLKSSCLRAN